MAWWMAAIAAAQALQSMQQQQGAGGGASQTNQQPASGTGGGGLFGSLGSLGSMFGGSSSQQSAPAAGLLGGIGRLLGGGNAGSPAESIGAQIGSLLGIGGGPGRGETRRAKARSYVSSQPGLLKLQTYAKRGSGTRADAEYLVRTIASADSEAHYALLGLLQQVQQAGGLGSGFGEQGNYLQDVVKWVFAGETAAPKRFFPSFTDLAAWLQSPLPYGYGNVQPMTGFATWR